MASPASITETEILNEVIDAGRGDLTPDVAHSLLQWRFSDRAAGRMSELADRGNKGVLSAAEREELEKYLRVGNLVNLVQAKARLSLKGTQPAS
jgi:hypothetical protein